MRKTSVSSAKARYTYLWLSLIIFLLTSVGIFSSRAQSLFLTKESKIAETKSLKPLPENPVYSPLARSVRSYDIPSLSEKPDSEDSLPPLEPSFSWGGWAESPWWISDYQYLSSESNWLRGSHYQALQEKSSHPDLLPKIQSRDIDPLAIMSNFITMGVADLLDDLSEQETTDAGDVQNLNPFEKALREAIDEDKEASGEGEVDPDKAEESVESNPADNEGETDSVNADDTIGGGGPPVDRNLLFVGSFGGQPLATAVGTVQPDLLHQSLNHPVFIELQGAGEQFLDIDMDVVLRDRGNSESVAFGDLNGDGFIDMVVTNKTTSKAHIFKGDGQGNYEAGGEIYGGLGPSAAVISDFSADGSPDIAVAHGISKRIVVDGKGLRKFIHLPTSAVAEDFSSIIPYDFDGDGLMDLLLSNFQELTASIYLNQGSGLFAASDSLALRTFPYLLSRVDLNADRIDDHVYIQGLGDNISVVMKDGKSGTISNLGNMTLDSALYFVLGDFNLDGIVDIALAHRR